MYVYESFCSVSKQATYKQSAPSDSEIRVPKRFPGGWYSSFFCFIVSLTPICATWPILAHSNQVSMLRVCILPLSSRAWLVAD